MTENDHRELNQIQANLCEKIDKYFDGFTYLSQKKEVYQRLASLSIDEGFQTIDIPSRCRNFELMRHVFGLSYHLALFNDLMLVSSRDDCDQATKEYWFKWYVALLKKPNDANFTSFLNQFSRQPSLTGIAAYHQHCLREYCISYGLYLLIQQKILRQPEPLKIAFQCILNVDAVVPEAHQLKLVNALVMKKNEAEQQQILSDLSSQDWHVQQDKCQCLREEVKTATIPYQTRFQALENLFNLACSDDTGSAIHPLLLDLHGRLSRQLDDYYKNLEQSEQDFAQAWIDTVHAAQPKLESCHGFTETLRWILRALIDAVLNPVLSVFNTRLTFYSPQADRRNMLRELRAVAVAVPAPAV